MLQALNIFQIIKAWIENGNTALAIPLILSMDKCLITETPEASDSYSEIEGVKICCLYSINKNHTGRTSYEPYQPGPAALTLVCRE